MEIKDNNLDYDQWGVTFGFDQVSGFSEAAVVQNAIKQYERDQVVEHPGIESIKNLFSEGIVGLNKKMTDSRRQTGEVIVDLDSDELFLVARSLAHFSSRTADELKFAVGAPSLEVAHTRIVEAGVAGFMLNKIMEAAPQHDDRFRGLIKPTGTHFGFSRALQP